MTLSLIAAGVVGALGSFVPGALEKQGVEKGSRDASRALSSALHRTGNGFERTPLQVADLVSRAGLEATDLASKRLSLALLAKIDSLGGRLDRAFMDATGNFCRNLHANANDHTQAWVGAASQVSAEWQGFVQRAAKEFNSTLVFSSQTLGISVLLASVFRPFLAPSPWDYPSVWEFYANEIFSVENLFSSAFGIAWFFAFSFITSAYLQFRIDQVLTKQQFDLNRQEGKRRSPPIGSVVAYAGPIDQDHLLPAGWLLADGRALSISEFPELYSAISTKHGDGGATSPGSLFCLPDYRGLFLRGASLGSGRDPNAGSRTASGPGGSTGDTVGSYQKDAFRTHTHSATVRDPGHAHTWQSRWGKFQSGPHGGHSWYHPDGVMDLDTTKVATGISVSLSEAGGSETRPKNSAVNYIIRAY